MTIKTLLKLERCQNGYTIIIPLAILKVKCLQIRKQNFRKNKCEKLFN